jgi:AcrR family transcriptional regulator
MNKRRERQDMAVATVRMRTEARQQEIVRAALDAIAEHGVQGATISRIAKGAGITPAALYSHFENRKAILLAALDVVYEQVFDSFRSSSSSDPLQRLREICEHHAEKVRNQDKTSHAHLFLEFVASAPEEGLREALRQKEQATASYLASIVEELKKQGGLAQGDEPELIAWLIAGWAWTGDVASSMGVASVWSERVSPRLLDLIFSTLSPGPAAAGAAQEDTQAPRGSAAVDGLPDGAVFTVEETADILKVEKAVVERMVLDKQVMHISLGGEVRIPRWALLACLRGLSAEEVDHVLGERARDPAQARP